MDWIVASSSGAPLQPVHVHLIQIAQQIQLLPLLVEIQPRVRQVLDLLVRIGQVVRNHRALVDRGQKCRAEAAAASAAPAESTMNPGRFWFSVPSP